MRSLCSNIQLPNHSCVPMRLWTLLPDLTSLLPFTTLSFTTFISISSSSPMRLSCPFAFTFTTSCVYVRLPGRFLDYPSMRSWVISQGYSFNHFLPKFLPMRLPEIEVALPFIMKLNSSAYNLNNQW